MGKQTLIQWTDLTWNIAVGCTKVDEDCKYCYMYRQSLGNKRYDPKQVRKTTTVFNLPLKYKGTKSKCWSGRPLVFTSSLTDVFHPDIDAFRNEIWDIIRKCPHLIFQILTKRPERIYDHLPEFWDEIADRCWLGTSIGSQAGIERLLDLVTIVGNPKRFPLLFLSLEPLHGEIDLSTATFQVKGREKVYKAMSFINWVIVGGESGNDNGPYKYRPCKLEWIEKIVTQCNEQEIPVFVKQLGTHLSKEFHLSDRHGGNIEEFPKHLQIRQFPKP